MPFWNKDADWLPLSNAIAQVKFYESDLKYAEKYLEYVKKFPTKKIPNYQKLLKIANDDVKKSVDLLEKAKKKLEESKLLEKQGRK